MQEQLSVGSSEVERRGRTFAALYAQGRSIRSIAAETGWCYGTVRRILLLAGVTLRKPGRW
ncbi:MAG: helix-turn-helix domain-containing protein [Solirubrobacteraceae bacterium]